MKQGRELDKLIAEKVFGCTVKLGKVNPEYYLFCGCEGQPHTSSDDRGEMQIPWYSSNISEAWLVVDKLNLLGGERRLIFRDGKYEITDNSPQGMGYRECIGESVSPAHAICLAALNRFNN